jgi:hypothetical protein
VVEKDGEDRLHQSCEKWSVTESEGGEEYSTKIKRRKPNCTGNILYRNCLLKHIIEGKIEGRIQVMGRWGRICKQLLDDFQEKRGYWKLKEEALDITQTCFGTGYGPVVRQMEWMNGLSGRRAWNVVKLSNWFPSMLELVFANDLILLANTQWRPKSFSTQWNQT